MVVVEYFETVDALICSLSSFEISYNSGKEPSVEEISQKIKMSEKQVELVLNTIQLEPVSLDTPIADNLSLEDYIPDDNYNSPDFNVQNHLLKRHV